MAPSAASSPSHQNSQPDGPSALKVKPIIREVVRTGVHVVDLTLLVDKIILVPVSDQESNSFTSPVKAKPVQMQEANDTTRIDAEEVAGAKGKHRQYDDGKRPGSTAFTYHVLLSDTEKSIQALLRRRLHSSIALGEIKEGSIVVLRDYALTRGKRINPGSGDGNSQRGEVLYLQVGDFYAIGSDGRREGHEAEVTKINEGDERKAMNELIGAGETEGREAENKYEHDNIVDGESDRSGASGALMGSPSLGPSSRKRKRESGEILNELDMNARPPFRDRSRTGDEPIPTKKTRFRPMTVSPSPTKIREYLEQSPNSSPHSQSARAASQPPPQPHQLHYSSPTSLKITPLAELTGRNVSRNQMHNVLAIITHVSDHTYKPPTLPHRKRDISIRDPSTPKHVLLSVFVNAEAFTPKVGTVALFRDVMTHDWGGGNLKKWPWTIAGGDMVGEPEEWCVPEPAGKVGGLSSKDVEWVRQGVAWKVGDT